MRPAALLGAIGVALGAFGAHALRGHVPPEDLEIWRTAVLYHLLHAVALLALASVGDRVRLRRVVTALWLAGVVVFSGSLYALVLTGARWLGAITPAGGVALIAGWATLFVSGGGVPQRRDGGL
jgi:uncharacterized membrane protein YgdD (TMEM256/DUF423 family)